MDEVSDEGLAKEIERMEYEKPRLVVWTALDEFRLNALKELAQLRAEIALIDEALARRPAIADAPNRYTAICRACDNVRGVRREDSGWPFAEVRKGRVVLMARPYRYKQWATARPDPAREALVGAFSCAEIDEICCEFSAPEYVATDDGEAWYWRFPGHELPVADDLGELLLAARMLLKRRALAEQGHKGATK